MTDIALGSDYDPDRETLTDTAGRPITADYLDALVTEAATGFDLTHAQLLTAADLAAMRTRGRPTTDADTSGESHAVSVRMNPELMRGLQAAAAARHVPVSTLVREAAAEWLHRHAS